VTLMITEWGKLKTFTNIILLPIIYKGF
jgi:hypothetical protein